MAQKFEDRVKSIKIVIFQEKYKEALEIINKEMKAQSSSEERMKSLLELKAIAFSEMDHLEESLKCLSLNNKIVNDLLYKKLKDQLLIESNLPKSEEENQKIRNFLKWVRKNDTKYSKLKLVYYSLDFRGIHASSSIKKNEIFLRVPLKLIITESLGKTSCELGKKLFESKIEISYTYLVYITLFILEKEKMNDQFWKPYLDVIPRTVSSFPLFYNEEEIKMLKGCEILDNYFDDKKWYEDNYNLICSIVPQFHEYSKQKFMEIITIVQSRIFFVRYNDKESEYMVVPLADMFNYEYSKYNQCYWDFNKKSQYFEVKAKENIERGESIIEDYGRKSMLNYLYYYGFIEPSTDLVSVRLTFKNFKNQNNFEILTIDNNSTMSLEFLNDFDKKRNTRNLTKLRFALYEEDLQEYLKDKEDLFKEINNHYTYVKAIHYFISLKNEILMLNTLKNTCIEKLTTYCTSLEEDLNKQNCIDKMTENQRNIFRVLFEQKKLLNDLIALSNEGLQCLLNPLSYNYSLDSKFSFYISKLIEHFKPSENND